MPVYLHKADENPEEPLPGEPSDASMQVFEEARIDERKRLRSQHFPLLYESLRLTREGCSRVLLFRD